LNPRTPTGQPPQGFFEEISVKGLQINWDSFKNWLFKEYALVTARDRLNYAKKYAGCLLSGDLSKLKLLTDCQRDHALKALAALSKFLGVYGWFKTLIKNYGLKWGGKNSDQLIIERLTKVVSPDEVFNWIRQVKRAAPELSDFMDLMAVTGLRYVEAVESHNLIVKLTREGRLNEYFNREKQALEHFRFKEIFIRNSKKAFVSFVPESLVNRIGRAELVDWSNVKKKVAWRVKRLRFADIREAHATLFTKYLNRVEIDFLHGRVSSSIFMRHYFNPALITDLKQRAFKAIKEIEKTLQI